MSPRRHVPVRCGQSCSAACRRVCPDQIASAAAQIASAATDALHTAGRAFARRARHVLRRSPDRKEQP